VVDWLQPEATLGAGGGPWKKVCRWRGRAEPPGMTEQVEQTNTSVDAPYFLKYKKIDRFAINNFLWAFAAVFSSYG